MVVPLLSVVSLTDPTPPARLMELAAAAECRVHVVRPSEGEDVAALLPGTDGVVVLGGLVGAYEDARYPWLSAVKTMIAVAAIEQVPLLALSLGHQLAAVALGGQVNLNPAGPTRGVATMTLTEAGRGDPLLGAVPLRVLIVQWNDDVVVEVPPGAGVLAHATDGSISAVRYGEVAWGLQGHPEATSADFERWATQPDPARQRHPDAADVSAAADQVRAAERQLAAVWDPVLSTFLSLVRKRADGRATGGGDPQRRRR